MISYNLLSRFEMAMQAVIGGIAKNNNVPMWLTLIISHSTYIFDKGFYTLKTANYFRKLYIFY